LIKFLQDESGVSAVEFALIGPLLSMMFLGTFASWSYMRQNSNMRDSVEAVAKYYVQGGTSDTQAAVVGNAAWSNKPSDGTLSIVRTKTCGTLVVALATLNCAGGAVPQVKLVVTASSAWTDPTSSTLFPAGLNLVQSETIRVR
jgi:Flp pilus assembly protein TadG